VLLVVLPMMACGDDPCPIGSFRRDGRCIASTPDAGGGEGEGEGEGADAGVDAAVDSGCDAGLIVFSDLDHDGFGDDDTAALVCDEPSGSVRQAGDCDDEDATTNPDAEESCDFDDNDCDGLVDTDLQAWTMEPVRLTDDDVEAFETQILPVDDGYLVAWSMETAGGLYEVHSLKVGENFEVLIPERFVIDLPDFLYFTDLVRRGDSILLLAFRRRDWGTQSRAVELDQDGEIGTDLELGFADTELGLKVEGEPTSTGIVGFFTLQDADALRRRTYVRYWEPGAAVTLVGAQFDDAMVRDAAGGADSDRVAVVLLGELDSELYIAAVDNEGAALIPPVRLTDTNGAARIGGIAATDQGFLVLYYVDGDPVTTVALDPDLNTLSSEATNLAAGFSPPDTIGCIGSDCFAMMGQAGHGFGIRFSTDGRVSGAPVALRDHVAGVDVATQQNGYVTSSAVTLVIGEDRELFVDRFGCP
jgi:hypothetical protein